MGGGALPLLGPDAILYENECGDSLAGGGMAHGHPVGPPLDKVAPDLDLISVDLYEGYLPSDPNGTAEAVAARAFVEKEVYPRLAPAPKDHGRAWNLRLLEHELHAAGADPEVRGGEAQGVL